MGEKALSSEDYFSDPKLSAENGTGKDGARNVGVGPWDQAFLGTVPDVAKAEYSHYDPELLRNGDRRNVIDRYRYWSREAIVADLDGRRHSFHVAIENWQHDMNIGSVVRSANAFLAKEIHIIGKKRWNRRGAMVTDRYQHVRHHAQVGHFAQWARQEGIKIIAIDNFPESVPLEMYALPKECVLVFGQEGSGLSQEAREVSDDILSIAQFGSTRSINAAAAAAVAMHSWIWRHASVNRPGIPGLK